MPKISVIVPVYNTEKYIEKCLNSILCQKGAEIEIIVVNDGSKDNSGNIIKKIQSNYPNIIKYYEKENGGLSEARNYGVKKATGDYLCFIDSDDFINKNLFDNLIKYIKQGVDLIKFKCIKVYENGEKYEKIDGPTFETKDGKQAFNELFGQDVLIEPAWLYLYKREFYLNNQFEFPEGKYHEDWGIVPYILLSANTVISTDIYGYYYLQSQNSITRNNENEKIFKRAYDMLEHYDNLIKKIPCLNLDNKTEENFKIFMSNCLVLKLEELPEKYYKQYIKELKARKVFDNFKARDFKQLIKKILLKINVNLYLKMRKNK